MFNLKYSSKLEWEFLQNDINLITYNIINDVPLYSIKSCDIKRGENFEIILNVNCGLNSENQSFFDNGFFLDEIIFENYREIIKVNHCKIKHKTFSVGENSGYHFIFNVNHIKRIYKTHNLENEVCYIKEWYLNSIHDNLVFTRPTRYNVNQEYIKIRDNTPTEDIKFKEEYLPDSSGDHLFLTLNKFNVILQKVPEEFGPEWSNCLGIEYHKEYNIPLPDVRRKTSQITSFLLGRNLIKIGETYYNSEWHIIGEIALSSGVSSRLNLKTISNYRDLPAIVYYDGFMDMYNWEIQASEIINSYLDCDLDLSQIMDNLLISMCVPTEAEIIMIGGCLDELSKKWFESDRSLSHGKIIEAKEYNNIISNELLAIEEKLEKYPEIYSNIENSYKLSGRKKVDLFLDELEIEVGASEDKARNYRNIPAHGQGMSDKTRFKFVYVTDIYRSFLNRILLKLLGFHSYYDLTSGNMRSINEKISEKDFEKNIKELERFYYEHYTI